MFFSDDRGHQLRKWSFKLHFGVFVYSDCCKPGADENLWLEKQLVTSTQTKVDPDGCCSFLGRLGPLRVVEELLQCKPLRCTQVAPPGDGNIVGDLVSLVCFLQACCGQQVVHRNRWSKWDAAVSYRFPFFNPPIVQTAQWPPIFSCLCAAWLLDIRQSVCS